MKRIIIICLALIFFGAIFAFVFYPHAVGYNVSVTRWDDAHEYYVICKTEYKDSIVIDSVYRTTGFRSSLSLGKLAKQNEDYIGRIKDAGGMGGVSSTANLYFHDNSYYIIYENDISESGIHGYTAMALYCEVSYTEDSYSYYVPFPMWCISIAYYTSDMYAINAGIDIVEKIFENLTFDELCEFYGRFTDETAEIDYENKIIRIDACSMKTNEKQSKIFCVDYENRRFIWDEGGDNEWIMEERDTE